MNKLSERIKNGPHNDPHFMQWVVEQVQEMEDALAGGGQIKRNDEVTRNFWDKRFVFDERKIPYVKIIV